MKRWNGWGDDSLDHPLPPQLRTSLEEQIGPGHSGPDASIEEVLTSIPESRIPENPAWSLDQHDRLRHARGQSAADWIALRSGQIQSFPDAVAYPTRAEHLQDLYRLASQNGLQLIPYGGGTSVVGHINPLPDPPSVTVDMRGFSGLLELDSDSGLATFGAGSLGPEIEASLAIAGFTLGHYPQSFEYSTLGGWIATRSTGQQSDGYGRIEAMFRGGQLVSPAGLLELPVVPASAAGPDLRQFVLGSEGRFGILTRATVRVRPMPEQELFLGSLFPEWQAGLAAARACSREAVPLSMLRLSDALETAFSLATAGHEGLRSAAEKLLALAGYGEQKCLMIYALSGSGTTVRASRRQAGGILRRYGGLPLGGWIGEHWRRSRFRTPYLRNTLWDIGYLVDTIETALPWSAIAAGRQAVLAALRRELEPENQTVLAFSHLSHRYSDGASLYFTFLLPRSSDAAATLDRWRRVKDAALGTILHEGGTLSHHHGVGRDHLPYMKREVSAFGLRILESTRAVFDPHGLLNPGKLLPGRGDPQ